MGFNVLGGEYQKIGLNHHERPLKVFSRIWILFFMLREALTIFDQRCTMTRNGRDGILKCQNRSLLFSASLLPSHHAGTN